MLSCIAMVPMVNAMVDAMVDAMVAVIAMGEEPVSYTHLTLPTKA